MGSHSVSLSIIKVHHHQLLLATAKMKFSVVDAKLNIVLFVV